jgi:type II secretory ATPase GspE/PulE/Tfp pilus assembly ATPase PilB-like protein
MSNTAPIVKLVYAVLLSALKKRAQVITIRFDATREYHGGFGPREAGASIIEFTRDGVIHEELDPPRRLHAHIVRRLSVMANLPIYGKDEVAAGRIHLRIGDTRHAYFTIRVGGHGDAMWAQLEVVAPEHVPPNLR